MVTPLEAAQRTLYIASTAAIAFTLLLLAIACLREVRWWPKRLSMKQSHGWRKPLWAITGPGAQGDALYVPELRECAAFFVLALLSQWLIIWTGHILSGNAHVSFALRIWERFTTAGDAPHYLWLAQNGYVPDGEEAKFIVFYPLYPWLIRICTGLLGGVANYGALWGMIISQVCFGLASVTVVRLAGRYFAREQSLWIYASWLIYPFVFFCFGVYTESLFMLLSLLSLLAMEEKQWVKAGILGLLAALCRTQGIALIFPAVLCWLRQEKGRRADPRALALLLIPAGFGGYLLCNQVICGDWFAYLEYQSAAPWYNTAHWIGENLATQLGIAASNPWLAGIIYLPQILLYFIGLLAVVSLLARRKAIAPALYATAYLGMSYLHGWMISGGRYMLGCYALFLAIGAVKHRWLRGILLFAEFAAMIYMVTMYMQGQAIM